jgi:hypothetical protein
VLSLASLGGHWFPYVAVSCAAAMASHAVPIARGSKIVLLALRLAFPHAGVVSGHTGIVRP